jgi:hypothetical protein
MSKKIDLVGMKFGRLTVIAEAEKHDKHLRWMCECDCGNRAIVLGDNLKKGASKSCGCLQRELSKETAKSRFTTHGKSHDRIYNTYQNIKKRCYSMKSKDYESYGGRGITVCDEWLGEKGFENFYNWAISNGYSDKLSIDRINVDGRYEPENCRWITNEEQQCNKRNSNYLHYNGETKTISEWAKIKGISDSTLRSRIGQWGWSVERALET